MWHTIANCQLPIAICQLPFAITNSRSHPIVIPKIYMIKLVHDWRSLNIKPPMAILLPCTTLTEGQLHCSFNSPCLTIKQMLCPSISPSYPHVPSCPCPSLTKFTLLRNKRAGMVTLNGRNIPTRQRGQQRYYHNTNSLA